MHVHARPSATAVEHRPEVILANIVGLDRADFGLGHLPDLLFERHAGDDRAYAGFLSRVERKAIADVNR